MVNSKTVTADTALRKVSWLPIIPQTWGISEGSLCRVNPCSVIGRAVSHEEAPFSLASSMARFRQGGSLSFSWLAMVVRCDFLDVRTLAFATCWWCMASWVMSCCCDMMSVTIGAVTFSEDLNS